jgi:type III pantothenate kinase
MNILAVDIGNTSVHCGVLSEGDLFHTFSFSTEDLLNSRNFPPTMHLDIVKYEISHAVFASVVPEANSKLIAFLKALELSAVKIDHTSIQMPMSYSREELGIDRLLGSYAAHELWGIKEDRPVIVIDIGTATTYDCVSSGGSYLGGAIALGPGSSAEYLSSRAAQLPEIPLEFPESPLGHSTITAMQSGILYGALASVEGMIAKLTEAAFSGESPIVVMTGGLAKLFEPYLPGEYFIEPNLVLLGINIAFRKLQTQGI